MSRTKSPTEDLEVPTPPPQIAVRDWVAQVAAQVGYETANAFVATYGRDTDTVANLEVALRAFQLRVV